MRAMRANVWKVRRFWNRGRVGDHSSEKRVSCRHVIHFIGRVYGLS